MVCLLIHSTKMACIGLLVLKVKPMIRKGHSSTAIKILIGIQFLL